MSRSSRPVGIHRRSAVLGACALSTLGWGGLAAAADLVVTPEQRETAKQVASGGVAIADLAPNAPDTYAVKSGDTLWDISKLFLRSPWRWPELWGMNLREVQNPHLIYPGQVLMLEKADGRARLRLAQQLAGPGAVVKLSPRVRSEPLGDEAITSIPLHLIAPFLNEAVVFNSNELDAAPRIVATQEGRVNLTRGDLAYVRGEVGPKREYRVFREATPLLDPTTQELLGYEARFVGTADYTRPGETRQSIEGQPLIVPATFAVTSSRVEMGVGDRLSPVPAREFSNYAPHRPAQPLSGQIISVYGDGLQAGQNQIVSLNRGTRDGVERGHVLAVWHDGQLLLDRTDPERAPMKLPDERQGMLFVFSVFDRVSYGQIVQVQEPVTAGDRFSQP